MIKYYVLDTETTGLKAGYNEIIQLSIIRQEDDFQANVNINPDFLDRISGDVLRIVNKTKYEIKKGIDKKDAVDYIDNVFSRDGLSSKKRCIIAHNASFDMRFCHALWASVGKQFPADLWLCSLALSKEYSNSIGIDKFAKSQNQLKPKYGLNFCLDAVGLEPIEGQHNAIIDTENTNRLVKFLMQQNINHVPLIKNNPHKVAQAVEYDIDDF